MITIQNIETYGWEAAIRGMRNPMNSWDKSDSGFKLFSAKEGGCWCVGNNDRRLMHQLVAAGTDHSKFMRQIGVSMDITAPLYWWKEFDTYKVGTTANSCSTMHKIAEKEFTLDDFSHEHLLSTAKKNLASTIDILNGYRDQYNVDTNPEVKKNYWWQMIQLLPSSYNQKRTVTLNYAVLRNQYHARRRHKLDEWQEYCYLLEDFPCGDLITMPSKITDFANGGKENER